MRRKIFTILFFLAFISIAFSSHKDLSTKSLSLARNPSPDPQNVPAKKPKYDYMSTFLSRNTNPLGLKDDAMLKKLLKQSSIKWAIRAGKKHILN